MLKNLLYFRTNWDHIYSSTATFLVCHPPVTSQKPPTARTLEAQTSTSEVKGRKVTKKLKYCRDNRQKALCISSRDI